MDKELEKYLNKMGRQNLYSIILTFIGVTAFFVFIISLIEKPVDIMSLTIFVICAIPVYYINEIIPKKRKGFSYPPVVLHSENVLSFEYIQEKFLKLTSPNNTFEYKDDIVFYKICSDFDMRVILYNTDDFSKSTFDKIKRNVNRKANSLYPSNIKSRNHGFRHIHFNVIYTDNYNEKIRILISNSALSGLKRIDGTINLLVYNNQLIIPPLYGDCELPEIRRYKKIINFILERIL